MVTDDFIRYIKAEKRYSENTSMAYERDLDNFTEYVCGRGGITVAEFDPAAVTPDDIRGWIVSLSERGLGPASINRMESSLRSFYHYLRKRGAVTGDPFRRIGNMKTPTRLPDYIPESRIAEMIDAGPLPGLSDSGDMPDSKKIYIRERNSLILLLFYSTGIRLAELKNIRLEDFSADLSELRIKGKGNKERIVPVIDHTRRKIGQFIERFNGPDICFSPRNFLFLTEKGAPLSRSTIYKAVTAQLAQAGVQGKRSPHVLRHTFATHLLNDGADIKEIQELLGHSSLGATQIYTHNSIARLKEVYRSAHPRGTASRNKKR